MKALFLLWSLTLFGTLSAQEYGPSFDSTIQEEEIISELYTEAILSTLSDDYFRGRDIRDEKIEEVREYLISVMKNNNFSPLIDNEFLHPFEINEKLSSKFILAIYRGDSSTLSSTLLIANYDNIGVFQKNSYSDSIFNGANDNASGVTALIQAAIYLSKKKIKKNIIIALTAGRRFGYSGHSVISDKLLASNIRVDHAFRFLRLAQPVTKTSSSIFINGSNNCSKVASRINLLLGNNYLIPIDNLNPMKEHEQPFHNLIENLTGAECYTFTTFNYTNDPQFFTPQDDYQHIDINYFHNSVKTLSKGLYGFIESLK